MSDTEKLGDPKLPIEQTTDLRKVVANHFGVSSPEQDAIARVRRVLQTYLNAKVGGLTVAPGASAVDAANDLLRFILFLALEEVDNAAAIGNDAKNRVEELTDEVQRLQSDLFLREDTIDCQRSWLAQRDAIILKLVKNEPLRAIDEICLSGILKEHNV